METEATMMLEHILTALAAAIVGGTLTSVAAFAALRVEIRWQTKNMERIDASVNRAHDRIDAVDARHAHLSSVMVAPGIGG